MKAQPAGESKDMETITGMFELLQEEGLTAKREGGSAGEHGFTDT